MLSKTYSPQTGLISVVNYADTILITLLHELERGCDE